MNPGEHERGRFSAVRDGHATKSRDSTGFSFDHAEPLTKGVGEKDECRKRVCIAMSLQRCFQVDISDDLSVDHDERLVLEELARVVERTAGSEYLGFFNIMKLYAEPAAIAEGSSYRLRPMMQVHDDLIDAVAGEIFGDVTDERFSEDWYRGFGSVFSEWPKACAVAGRKNDRAHQPTDQEAALEASRMTRSNVPGATLRKRVLRLSETATLIVGF